MDFGDCTGKTPYATKAKAMERIKYQQKRRKAHRVGRWYGHTEMTAYRCRQCHHWHVGASKPKAPQTKGRRRERITI